MADILRSWHCMNSRCGKTFDAWEPNPSCPACKGVRVDWVPGGGHIAGTARSCDADLRALADCFRMTDMNSTDEGRGAKKVRSPDAPQPNSGPVHTFAPGFAAPVNAQMGAQCMPSQAKVEFKAKVGMGSKLAPSKTWGAPTPMIEARHKP